MSKPLKLLLFPCLLSLAILLRCSTADVGTAAYYGPPYLPTVCYGRDPGQFPGSGLFAAAGEGIWDNGASCGRQYLVRCLSSATPNACIKNRVIQVRVVDQGTMLNSMPSRNGTTMVLSNAAFQMIASEAAQVINIEFTQV
ncbi:EG45-like domain containing protein [Elaeis guineensis]|uniref:EG45-like domain containing protein n=1 Tax=Elaeis guineensis var. tenera TaxID=51953 RepID=A0A6I9QMX0_ELAGV|nr:EG45-like domain containing protein [Elaeis guineensis]